MSRFRMLYSFEHLQTKLTFYLMPRAQHRLHIVISFTYYPTVVELEATIPRHR